MSYPDHPHQLPPVYAHPPAGYPYPVVLVFVIAGMSGALGPMTPA